MPMSKFGSMENGGKPYWIGPGSAPKPARRQSSSTSPAPFHGSLKGVSKPRLSDRNFKAPAVKKSVLGNPQQMGKVKKSMKG